MTIPGKTRTTAQNRRKYRRGKTDEAKRAALAKRRIPLQRFEG